MNYDEKVKEIIIEFIEAFELKHFTVLQITKGLEGLYDLTQVRKALLELECEKIVKREIIYYSLNKEVK